jgi:CHRD domain
LNETTNLDISNSSPTKLQEKPLSQSLPPTHRTDCVINNQPADTSSFISPSSTDYTAALSPDEVVPAVDSTSSGEAYFSFDEGQTTLSYVVYAHSLVGVYSVHIHAGSEGKMGPLYLHC